jgi:O-antigen ligase/tetratricopeptide (TPR) repeat protein
MPVVSAFFLVISLALGVIYGPQLRPWSWGPAMAALALAVLSAVPALLRKRTSRSDFGMLALGVLVAGWFAARAWVSPAPEMAQADLLLLACAVGAFLCVRAAEGQSRAERVLIWGTALLLVASIFVAGMQFMDPSFSPIFHSRIVDLPTGFFAHYNEGANFVIGTTLLVAGAALFGQHSRWTQIFFGLVVIAGIIAVYFTRSRGGLLGLTVGGGVFVIAAAWTASRQKLAWFAPAMIALPIICLGVVGFLMLSWSHAQTARGYAASEQLLDNDIRLYLVGIAISCIGLHPWAGGGSRSYGWECYRFWESSVQGQGHARPEFIHNELLQAVTDYGIIGGAALLLWVMLTIMIAVTRMGTPIKEKSNSLAWQVGGIAAFMGVFTQSNFSFVFHMMPLTVLLGICLGYASRTSRSPQTANASNIATKILLCGAACLCITALSNYGVKGTRVSLILWPSMFGKQPSNSLEERLQSISSAIDLWPQSAFYMDRAFLLRELAGRAGKNWAQTEEMQKSVKDLSTALAMNPYDPSITINQANLLSSLTLDAEAEEAYAKTLSYQGGMENAFLGHSYFAQHLYTKGIRQYRAGELNEALETLESAADQIDKSSAIIPWHQQELRVEIHSSLGAVREMLNDYKGALEAYDFTCTMPGGHIAHFRAGLLLRRMGVEAWESRQPSNALAYFIEAKRRATISGNIPPSYTSKQREELLTYLDTNIAFLEQTKVTPTQGLIK